MKFKFDVPELQKRLGQLAAVVARKAQEPVYGNVKLSSDAAGAVTLQGVDIDSTLTVKLATATADAAGSILLEYKKLNSIVQSFRAKEATITFENEQSASISSNKFNGVVQGSPTAKFSELAVVQAIGEKPELGGYLFGLPGLKEQIEQVAFAIPAPDGKFVVPSVLLESTADTLRMVATDGFSMAISSVPANLGDFSYTLPKPLIELLLKLDGGPTVTIVDTETAFYVSTELELLTYSKTHSEFPPYSRVIPAAGTYPTTVTIKEQGDILASLGSIRPLCDEKEPGVKFTVAENGKSIELHAIHAAAQATGDAFTNVADDEIDAETTGAANVFKLNIDRLIPFLSRATFPVNVIAKDGTKIVDFHANGGTQDKPVYRFLMMPMRME